MVSMWKPASVMVSAQQDWKVQLVPAAPPETPWMFQPWLPLWVLFSWTFTQVISRWLAERWVPPSWVEAKGYSSHEVRPARCMSGGAVCGQTALRFASSCFLLIIQRSGLPPCGSP
ncbi:hypothetical protein ACH4V1_34910 [Streptomyces anandii]|uniref:hypothetical protein n=1 Tax=Streptomyces anandii TaxID=285454 RepID=UPI0037973357